MPLMAITESEILETIQAYKEKEKYLHMGLRLEFYLKEFSKGFLLVIVQLKDQTMSVSEVYLLKREFITQIQTTHPIQVLESFIDKFGLDIQIGGERNQFFIKKAIPLLSGRPDPMSAIAVINPQRHNCWLTQYIQFKKSGTYVIVQVALAYCIDVTEYKHWIT